MGSRTTIFLGSTHDDLKDHRQLVLKALAALKQEVEAMEYFQRLVRHCVVGALTYRTFSCLTISLEIPPMVSAMLLTTRVLVGWSICSAVSNAIID